MLKHEKLPSTKTPQNLAITKNVAKLQQNEHTPEFTNMGSLIIYEPKPFFYGIRIADTGAQK